MTIQQLRIFAAVAKERNLTKAAKALHVSRPSVSQHLKSLEEESGVKLYKKVGRGIELTDKGQLFLSEAEPILLQVEKLNEKFKSNSVDRKAGTLVCGGSHSPSVFLLPMLLAIFEKTHPQVELIFRTDTSRRIEQLVLDSEVEIALITNLSHHSSLIYKPYRQEQLVVFASVGHPLAKKERLTLAELAQAPLIVKNRTLFHESRTDKLLRELERRGFKLNIVAQCDSRQSVIAAVRAGGGLGVSYRDNVKPDIEAGILKEFKIPELKLKTKVYTFIIHHKERPLSPYAEDFLTLLREWPKRTHWVKGSLRAA